MKCCCMVLIASIVGGSAVEEKCVSTMINNRVLCSSNKTALTYVELAKQMPECQKHQTKTACADQSGCAWQEGPRSSCTAQMLFDQSQEQSKNEVCRKHSKDECAALAPSRGCIWGQPEFGPHICMLQSIENRLKTTTYSKDRFCSSTSKSVCDADGDNCKTESVVITKDVCDGRSISPWTSNGCLQNYARTLVPCVAKLDDIKDHCARVKAELVCAQAFRCYEVKPDLMYEVKPDSQVKPDVPVSMKASCDQGKSPTLQTRWTSPGPECKLQCSLPDSVKKSKPGNASTASAAVGTCSVGAGAFATVVALVVASN